MKDLNKILYDILLKLEKLHGNSNLFGLNKKLVVKYFNVLKIENSHNFEKFEEYFNDFYNFCFELSLAKHGKRSCKLQRLIWQYQNEKHRFQKKE